MDFKKHHYVPMRHDFESTDEAIELARLLRREGESLDDVECRVEAKCRRLWSWVDRTTEDASIKGDPDWIFEAIDDRFRCPGFAAALASEKVGWLAKTEDGVAFPNLPDWIGQTARRRAKDRERKRRERASASSDVDVRVTSDGQDEETSTESPTPPRAGAPAGLGLGLGLGSGEAQTQEEGVSRCVDAAHQPEKAKKPPGRKTWLTPYFEAHDELVGETDGGLLARYLRPLDKKYGASRVVPVWRHYCETASGQYFAPKAFSARFLALEREMKTGGASAARRSMTAAEKSMETARALTAKIDPKELGGSKSISEILSDREASKRAQA